MSIPLEAVALDVLRRFDAAPRRTIALGNSGGFSGAHLWRVTTDFGDWCLKAWPPDGIARDRLTVIHALQIQARDSGLTFVPIPRAAPDRATTVEAGGRVWDLTTWMPGQPASTPATTSQVQAACIALAQLHRTWQPRKSPQRPFPAAVRRVQAAVDWCRLVEGGWFPEFDRERDTELARTAQQAWEVVRDVVRHIPELLNNMSSRSVEVQPCLCDIWPAHVLFDGEAVSGVIDYGGVKADHVAVDLARLLGGLTSGDRSLFDLGIAAYRAIRPLSDVEADDVMLLDRTGTLLGIANWLRWLYHERRAFADRAAVTYRLAELVRCATKTPAGR